jgi:predicted  nucleic acid-binding Zn-ribbon protein
MDAAKARLDKALARLTEEVTANTARAALGTGGVDHATHQALSRDYELLRDERDELAARLRAAEERLAALGRDADELTRRLDGAIARVERLMES